VRQAAILVGRRFRSQSLTAPGDQSELKVISSHGNIYLIGFSGTGKTNSGRQAADLLGWEFFEMDDRIEEVSGKKISDIFGSEGEARFREIETGVLREAAAKTGLVVSTGGGVPTISENRHIMAETGVVIRLSASPETIHARLRGSAGQRGRALRPLLGSEAPVEKVRELLAAREPAYSTADVQIDTEGKRHDDVAREIVAAWRKVSVEKGLSDA
jgi:shikimate kinase